MDCRMPLAKEEKTSGKANNLLLSFSLAVRSCILYCALRFSFHFFHQLHFPLFGPVYPSFFLRVYLKSRKYGLFLQTQRDFALKSLGIHKGFQDFLPYILLVFAKYPSLIFSRLLLLIHIIIGANQ